LFNEGDGSPRDSFEAPFCDVCSDEIASAVPSVPAAFSVHTLASLARRIVSLSVVVALEVEVEEVFEAVEGAGVLAAVLVIVVVVVVVVVVVFVVVVVVVEISVGVVVLFGTAEDNRSVEEAEVQSGLREEEIDGLEEMTEQDMLFESIFPLATGLSHV
jgi:hypothetical protein